MPAAAAWMSALSQVWRCPAWVDQSRGPLVHTVSPVVTEMTANVAVVAV
jgi:hypothetical protein